MKRKGNFKKLQHYNLGTWLKNAGSWVNENIVPGLDGNLFSTLGSLMASKRQYDEANNPLRVTNVYSPNQYERAAINDLYGLRSNYYPVAAKNMEIEDRSRAAIARSGGLSVGQRLLANRQLTLDTQNRNSEAIYQNLMQNNQLKANAAQAALNTGAQTAARRQLANMFDEEMLAKAHNASLQGRQTAMFNAINALQQYYANNFKKNQFNRTMNLYQQMVNSEDVDRKAKNAKSAPKAAKMSKNISPYLTGNFNGVDTNVYPEFNLKSSLFNWPVLVDRSSMQNIWPWIN